MTAVNPKNETQLNVVHKDVRDVSVIIPVYNRIHSLERAVSSVLRQTVQPTEILIVDDGSGPDFEKEIRAFEVLDSSIRVLREPLNQGAASARNRGFREAKGHYIALLDSDDYWDDEKLERQFDAIVRTGARFSTTAYWLHGERYDAATMAADLRIPDDLMGLRDIVWGCRNSPGSTSMFERSLLDEVGGQDEAMQRLEDWEWLIRVIRRAPVISLSEPLTHVVASGKPLPEAVGTSLKRLVGKHLMQIVRKNPLDGLRFLSTCNLELSAANFYAGRKVMFLIWAILSFLSWPMRNAQFFRRVFSTIFGISPDVGEKALGDPPDTVLHVISSLESGGAERMLTNLVLAERTSHSLPGRRDVVVTLQGRGKYYDVLHAQGVPIYSLNLTGVRDIVRTYLQLRRIIGDEKPGVVKCWMYYANILGLLATRFPFRSGKCRVLWGVRCSNMDLTKYSMLLRLTVWMNGLFSYLADGIIANSYSGLRHHLTIGFSNRNWREWDNGVVSAQFDAAAEVPQEKARQRFGLPASGKLIVGTSARNDPMKGYSTYTDLLRARPDVLGVAAGTGTRKIKGPDNLIALGEIKDVPVYLRGLDIFVLCSHYGEGFSNALLEAMFIGLPIVATDVGDNARVLGGAGLVVPPNDSAALIKAVDSLLRDRETARELGIKARARATEKFQIDRVCREFRQIIAIE